MMPPRPPRLTIRQLLVLIAYLAVALAFVAPALREAPPLRDLLLFFAALAVPIAWALLTLVVARPGPIKDWLTWFWICLSMGTAVVTFDGVILWSTGRSGMTFYEIAGTMPLIINLVLGVPLLIVLMRLLPVRCGQCGRWSAIRDTGAGLRGVRYCVRCGARSGARRPKEPQVLPQGIEPRAPAASKQPRSVDPAA